MLPEQIGFRAKILNIVGQRTYVECTRVAATCQRTGVTGKASPQGARLNLLLTNARVAPYDHP